ncbi:hypothetical protein PBR31_00068 [Xanthomonas phage PBR31]|uniref:Uncharacterized protein n=1 Tax=Xanthomonas phage PPDBI TaxID=2723911 RepID=A0A6H0X5T7_9CAUD|nr:hypothetical protein PBR31_00068 [Xanthomonas phage PBR31]QIW89427.1 hypothetical protein PPDBI_00068 [Xanthomonas phage PPDBI]
MIDVLLSLVGLVVEASQWLWRTIHGWIGFGFLLVFIECWSLRSQLERLEEKYSRVCDAIDDIRSGPRYDD